MDLSSSLKRLFSKQSDIKSYLSIEDENAAIDGTSRWLDDLHEISPSMRENTIKLMRDRKMAPDVAKKQYRDIIIIMAVIKKIDLPDDSGKAKLLAAIGAGDMTVNDAKRLLLPMHPDWQNSFSARVNTVLHDIFGEVSQGCARLHNRWQEDRAVMRQSQGEASPFQRWLSKNPL